MGEAPRVEEGEEFERAEHGKEKTERTKHFLDGGYKGESDNERFLKMLALL